MLKTDDPIAAWAWAGIVIVLLIVLFAWMDIRNRQPEFTQCPKAGEGQRLIGRGHTEIDGETGELMCTYATAPTYGRMVAEK
jgi:hypothetical protein